MPVAGVWALKVTPSTIADKARVGQHGSPLIWGERFVANRDGRPFSAFGDDLEEQSGLLGALRPDAGVMHGFGFHLDVASASAGLSVDEPGGVVHEHMG